MAELLNEQALLSKLRGLPRERLAEVEDFVDFLREREADRESSRPITAPSEEAFSEIRASFQEMPRLKRSWGAL